MKFKLSYLARGNKIDLSTSENFENSDINIFFEKKKNSLKITLFPKVKIQIKEAFLSRYYSYSDNENIFINGYQSWTDSKEVSVKHKEKNFNFLMKPIIKKYKFEQYGDYTFYKCKNKQGKMHSYTYTYIRKSNEIFFLGSLSEKSGYTIIEHSTKENEIKLIKECKELEIDSTYEIFNLYTKQGTEKELFNEYFSLMGINKKNNEILRGWTSWYNYYEDITEEIIMENLNNFSDRNIELDCFQIDDGYQNAVGDWLVINEKFPNGMKYLADEIKTRGYDAGLWLAPFACEKKSILAKEHPDWILKDSNEQPVYGGSNWSSFYALDFYNPEVREYLRKVFDTVLNKWGYDIVKLDFLYAVCLLSRKGKTRGQIMCEAMEFLREICGNKKILGCGVPLGASFGLVDYCRIGCDVGLDWDDKFYMKHMHRERISTLNAIKNSIYRRQLDQYAFINDPDVFLLRKNNINLTQEEKETLFWINNIFGSVIFTSDNIAEYSKEEMKLYKKSFKIKNREILEVNENSGIVEIKVSLNSQIYEFFINFNNQEKFHKGNKLKKHQTRMIQLSQERI